MRKMNHNTSQHHISQSKCNNHSQEKISHFFSEHNSKRASSESSFSPSR